MATNFFILYFRNIFDTFFFATRNFIKEKSAAAKKLCFFIERTCVVKAFFVIIIHSSYSYIELLMVIFSETGNYMDFFNKWGKQANKM